MSNGYSGGWAVISQTDSPIQEFAMTKRSQPAEAPQAKTHASNGAADSSNPSTSTPSTSTPSAATLSAAQAARRSFMKTTAGVVAGTTLAGAASSVPAFHVAGREVIKIGLVGCGGRGTGAAQDAMRTAGSTELVALADAFENRLQGCLEECTKELGAKVQVPKENRFVGFDAYKGVMASDADVVILTTPPGFRPLHFEAAIAANKHVFMEKPVATDPAGVRRVLATNEIAKSKGLAVQVGLQRHHENRYRETIARLKDGAIGDINFARAYWNGDGVWNVPRRPEFTEMEYQMRNWYYFNWLCGDHIVEQHIHNIDVINWLFDDYPVKAQGQGGRQVRTGREYGEIYDHHFVEFTYADNAVMLSQCRHITGCWNSVSEFAHGSLGWANISAGRIYDKDGNEVWRARGGPSGYQQEHDHLFAELRAGRVPNEGDYGAKSTMTAILGRMATYTGREITWDQAFNSTIALADFDSLHSFDDVPPVLPLDDGSYPIMQPGRSWEKVVEKPVSGT